MTVTATGRAGGAANDARGMVTSEIAVGILGVLVASVLIATVVASLSLRAQCQATASEIARHAARGDDAAVAAVKAELPDHVAVTISEDGDLVVVTVRAPVRVGSLTLYDVGVTIRTRAEP